MPFAICGTETVTIKTVFLLWQGLTFALMFHFSISTNNVNKNVNVILLIKRKFFPKIMAINIVIVVNS